MNRDIEIANHHERLKISRKAIVTLFANLDRLSFAKVGPGDLSIVFMDNARIGRLHDQFMNDPEATDVITFKGDPHLGFAGEICVSAEYAAESAPRHDLPFSEELSLYLVHGWLHLAGYDDRCDEDRAAMREAERRAMAELKAMGPLPSFRIGIMRRLKTMLPKRKHRD